MKSFKLNLFFTLFFATNAFAALNTDLYGSLRPKTNLILSPTKKNTLTVDGRTYFIPDSLTIIKDDFGRYQVKRGADIDHKVGNGGDYLRGQFILIGNQVISFLENTLDGQNLLADRNLKLEDLKSTLDILKLVVVDDLLIDNSGSVVDAIGVPGLIIINSDSWKDHFEKERNIYYLVFHEMLRSSAVNDDNYVVSQGLFNFPNSLKVSTQLIPALPLLAEDSLSMILQNSKIATGGAGCANKSGRFFTDLNLATNTFELTFYDYVSTLSSRTNLDRKACSISIPVTLPKNKKLVVSLIDIAGQIDSSVSSTTAVGKITFEAFLAGSSQKQQTKNISLAQGKKSFLYRKTNVLSSACGGESMLRLNSNIILNRANTLTLQNDVTDVLQIKKISIYMNLEDCSL